MFERDSADICAGKFLLMLMGGRANGQACADCERHERKFKKSFNLDVYKKYKTVDDKLVPTAFFNF